SPEGEPAAVLVPPEPAAPRLHQRLSEAGIEMLEASCLRGLALPLCPGLFDGSIWREFGPGALAAQRSVALVEQLWLLLAAGVEEMAPGGRTVLRMIRRRVHRAAVTTEAGLSGEDGA
ncbi:MAG: hypothetical protein VKI81_12475, partial [Synechococcaceae cyanobacterium]|nr:hypothetical protein [Synechococcaceae cyanobacterium]